MKHRHIAFGRPGYRAITASSAAAPKPFPRVVLCDRQAPIWCGRLTVVRDLPEYLQALAERDEHREYCLGPLTR